MKTFSAKTGEFNREWFVVDAEGEVLGRLATRVATVLRGKHKPTYTQHTDVGDFVVVVNAEKVKLTGAKLDSKMYRRHSEYPGGLTEIPYRRLLETHPERAIERAVKGMLPHTILGRRQLRKLKVYAGEVHPHSSQKPQPLSVDGVIPVSMDRVPPREKTRRKPSAAALLAASAAAQPEVGPQTEPEKKKKSAPRKPKAKAKAKSAPRKSTAKAKPKSAPRRSSQKKENG